MNTLFKVAARLTMASMIGLGAAAQDWPQWRGPNRDARATGFQAPKTWPKELTKKWTVPVGEGVATPALAGERLYVFTRQDGNEVTRCLDATTGKELWRDQYESLGASGPAQGFSGPRSSPAAANGKLVTIGVRGVISCLEASTGKKLWRKDDFKAWPNFFPSSSPLILGGAVAAQLGGQENGSLVAYDLENGEQKWKWSGDTPGYASPVSMAVGGTPLVIAETERRIVAVSAGDGKLVWETPYAVQGRGYNASTPIADGQTLIYAGSGRGIKAVKIEKRGEAFSGNELWANSERSVQFNTPVVKNGSVYALSMNNQLFCLNEQDGKTLWFAPLPGASGPGPGNGPSGQRRPPAAGQIAPPEQARTNVPPGAGPGPGGRRGGSGGGGGFGSVVDAGPFWPRSRPVRSW